MEPPLEISVHPLVAIILGLAVVARWKPSDVIRLLTSFRYLIRR
jgi:hypothetical protein